MDRDRINRLERELALVVRQIAGLPIRVAEGGAVRTNENYRLIHGQSVGAQSAATLSIDNVVVLSGGLDPSSGNPATVVSVYNLFGQSYTDNEIIQAVYAENISGALDWETLKTTSGTERYRWVRGLVKGVVTADDASFVIDNVTPLSGGLDPVSGVAATELTVFNSQFESFYDNQPIVAVYDFDAEDWRTPEVERYRMIRGQAYTGFDGGDDTFLLDHIIALESGLDPRDDPTDDLEQITVHNIHDGSAESGELVVAVFNVKDNRWEALPTGGGGGAIKTAAISGTISGGSAGAPAEGTGTVYDVTTGPTFTSIGSKALFNPFDYAVKGSCTVSLIDGNDYLIVGAIPDTTCYEIVTSVSCVDGDIVYDTTALMVFAEPCP